MAAIVREWRTLRVRILDGPPSFLVAVFRRIHGLKPLLRQPPAHHKPSLSTDRGHAPNPETLTDRVPVAVRAGSRATPRDLDRPGRNSVGGASVPFRASA